MLTSLLIQLLQDFANDLSNALQRLDVFFCAVKLFLQVLDLYSQILQLGLPLAGFDELRPVRVEGGLALFFRRHGRVVGWAVYLLCASRVSNVPF